MKKTKYTVIPTTRFKKDLRKAERQGRDTEELLNVIETIAKGQALDEKYKDHNLGGDFKGCRECHIGPDWLLIYELDKTVLYLYLMRAGTHSELFGK